MQAVAWLSNAPDGAGISIFSGRAVDPVASVGAGICLVVGSPSSDAATGAVRGWGPSQPENETSNQTAINVRLGFKVLCSHCDQEGNASLDEFWHVW